MTTLKADLARNNDQFGRLAVRLLRASQRLGPLGVIPDVLLRVLCGTEIPRGVPVGPGVRLPHGSRGTVVHYQSVIGSGVTLYHSVTLGVSTRDQGAPVLEDDVYVGTGACILGGVRIGRGAKIGANAVVLKDVPAGATAVGNPARIVGAPAAASG